MVEVGAYTMNLEEALLLVLVNPVDPVVVEVMLHQLQQEPETELPELQHLYLHKEILVELQMLVLIGQELEEVVLAGQDQILQIAPMVDQGVLDHQMFMHLDHQIQ